MASMKNIFFFFSFLLCLASSHLLRAQDFLNMDSPSSQTRRDKDNFQSALSKAQRGNAKTMGNLGLMYEKGVGCAKDLSRALVWLKRGAKKGDAAAENNLAFIYSRGLGVQEDDTEALNWFQKAADQGLASAQCNLGLVYGRAMGVPKDFAKALDWFKKAAEQDELDAQVNLAQMLSLGEGAPKDYVESYKWFSIALRNSSLPDSQVTDLRDDITWLEKRMADSQIKEARKRASEWQPSQSAEP